MDNIDKPLISVVLPTYNVAQYLQQCLESVAAQTYRNIEVIIIIDGATDGSYEIAQGILQDRFALCRLLAGECRKWPRP